MRDVLIAHILRMMRLDIDYARHALRWYHQILPDLDLLEGVRQALKTTERKTT